MFRKRLKNKESAEFGCVLKKTKILIIYTIIKDSTNKCFFFLFRRRSVVYKLSPKFIEQLQGKVIIFFFSFFSCFVD